MQWTIFHMTSRLYGSSIIIPWIKPGKAANSVKCIILYGENPIYAYISACNTAFEIVTSQVLILFVYIAKSVFSAVIFVWLFDFPSTKIQTVQTYPFFSESTIYANYGISGMQTIM